MSGSEVTGVCVDAASKLGRHTHTHACLDLGRFVFTGQGEGGPGGRRGHTLSCIHLADGFIQSGIQITHLLSPAEDQGSE